MLDRLVTMSRNIRRFGFSSWTPGPPKPSIYRGFSAVFPPLRRGTFALAVGFDAPAGTAERAAAALRRTPGCSPLVNSTPARFKCELQRLHCALLQFVSPLKPSDGVNGHFCGSREFSNAQPEGRTRHAALDW